MKKIAFFVEGQTEQIFIDKLVKEILGDDNISIISKRSLGGTSVPKQELVRYAKFVKQPRYQVLIYDCGSDNRVKSEILENLENLCTSGYTSILGVRDLYPMPVKQLPVLEQHLKKIPSAYSNYRNYVDIMVVVQEIETWFLAETHHLRKVDRRLTGGFINKYLGFNPYAINAMQRRHPSKDINDIYKLVGKSYTKRYWQVQKLVNRLDYQNLIRNIRYEIPCLNELITAIEKFKN